MPIVAVNDIRGAVSANAFEAGRDYEAGGFVSDLRLLPEGRVIEAKVQGSARGAVRWPSRRRERLTAFARRCRRSRAHGSRKHRHRLGGRGGGASARSPVARCGRHSPRGRAGELRCPAASLPGARRRPATIPAGGWAWRHPCRRHGAGQDGAGAGAFGHRTGGRAAGPARARHLPDQPGGELAGGGGALRTVAARPRPARAGSRRAPPPDRRARSGADHLSIRCSPAITPRSPRRSGMWWCWTRRRSSRTRPRSHLGSRAP